ncbi:MAG: hypothetical protein ACRDTD_24975 [Pseudonocardiaceae bacterium]
MGELRSQKQRREQLVRSLRAQGKSWVEVVEALRQHYRVNARVAFRYAQASSSGPLSKHACAIVPLVRPYHRSVSLTPG